jgi:16S rRNA processing protein RimM
VAKPHGVRGELKVRLHWEPSDTLLVADSVVLSAAGRSPVTLRVESARRIPKHVLLKLAGLDDPQAAEQWRAAAVAVPRDALSPLPEGEFFLCDLVEARVFAPDGPVGEVIEVRLYPSVDVMVIRKPDGRVVEQPLADPWIETIDIAAGRVQLATTDGIIE